jgi:uncharacterized protein with ParB-like and HNH nuclease domain
VDANALKLMDFLGQNRTQFIIPVYQRNYEWKIEHCKQLLDDILQCGRIDAIRAHFIGSIVFIHDDIYSVSRVKELTIIDGQQRLITVTLIWLVIYKLAKILDRQELTEDVYEAYLVNKREEEKLKLRPTENNDKVLRYLIEDSHKGEYNEYSRLIENYEYFAAKIMEENLEIVLKGLSKLMFVEISLERGKDDPQRIFESLNSTGLDLSQADLIRNYILMDLKHEEQKRFYEQYWRPIEQLATESQSNNSRVSDFIRDYLTLINKKIPNKQKVYQEFKTSYDFKNFEKLESVLKELKKYVKYYNKLINVNKEADLKIREHIHNINRLEINVAYPFLMQVYADHDLGLISKDVFVAVLAMIEAYSWRRFIASVPTSALNKIFMRLYEDVEPTDYLNSLAKSLVKKKGSQRFPKDGEIVTILKERDVYGIQSRNRTFLLERLENYNNNEPVWIENNPTITIEHIFPRQPDANWLKDISETEYRQLADLYLHTLGNLTLSGNNGSLGNKTFQAKRDLVEKGYRDSRLYLNRYLSKLDRWGVRELEDRATTLIDRFIEIWPYPSIQLDEQADYEEVNLFDADDPTGKKLEYAIFLDEKLKCKNISDLYLQVCSTLFDLEPERFFGTTLAQQLSITKDKKLLRNPKSLNDIYFIELNLDNKRKFEYLKYILEIFEFTDELFIKYVHS